MRVGIVGSGLIGHKRARHLAGAELRMACDLDLARAELLANTFAGCAATTDVDAVFAASDVVVVCTANHALCDIALRAVRAGRHVLIEKPGAIRAADLETLQREAAQQKVLVRVGYNHRFHPALLAARALVDDGAVGELMFIRGRYGHGGRVDYHTEWRADPKLSGGGELIDQGVHLIDLAGWFLGPFTQVQGNASTFFWHMPVDDNAFLHLRTATGATAWLHASCTEWKNLFSFEIYGRTGKLQIDGLGGSYGVERLAFYKMLPEMGPPETTIWEYPRGDQSWELEFAAFLEDITLGRTPEPGLAEGIATLKIVEEIYRLSA
jgi:predicted dehydrogenase